MSENLYESPVSSLTEKESRDAIKMYSPNQIFAGSFLGGPIAAFYFLRRNYLGLGRVDDALKSLKWGIAIIIVILVVLPFLPEIFPNMVIPLSYSLMAQQLATSTQLNKSQIIGNGSFTFASNWNVLGISILSLVIFTVIGFGFVVGAEELGLISYEPVPLMAPAFYP